MEQKKRMGRFMFFGALCVALVMATSGCNTPQDQSANDDQQTMSDAECVAADKAALEITFAVGDSSASVTQDVGLPSTGANGSTITWASDDTAHVTSAGTVTRPPMGVTVEPVNLTAMLKKGAASDTKTFALTLPHRESLVHVWTQYFQGSAMPTDRQRYAMAYGGDNAVYLFSGWNVSEGCINNFWKYDLGTHTWTNIFLSSPYPDAREGASFAYAGGTTIVLFGGDNNAGAYYFDTWEYDTSTGVWSQPEVPNATEGTTCPVRRSDHGMAYAGGTKAALFGGYSGSVCLGDTWVFDSVSDTWTRHTDTGLAGTAMPYPLQKPQMAHAGSSQAILFGGNNGINLSETWVFDVSSDTWSKNDTTGLTEGTDFPSARSGGGMGYAGGNYIALFGGIGSAPLDDTWVYEVPKHAWTSHNTTGVAGTDFPSARYLFGMSGAGLGKLVIFGGSDGVASMGDTWEYE